MQLTSLTAATDLVKILVAPFEIFDALVQKIDREIEHAKAGKKTRIIAKLNALTEPQIIDKLYEASCAGIKIDLIVRGICSLRPGIPGLSDNIHVRSIVGPFSSNIRGFTTSEMTARKNIIVLVRIGWTETSSSATKPASLSGRNL